MTKAVFIGTAVITVTIAAVAVQSKSDIDDIMKELSASEAAKTTETAKESSDIPADPNAVIKVYAPAQTQPASSKNTESTESAEIAESESTKSAEKAEPASDSSMQSAVNDTSAVQDSSDTQAVLSEKQKIFNKVDANARIAELGTSGEAYRDLAENADKTGFVVCSSEDEFLSFEDYYCFCYGFYGQGDNSVYSYKIYDDGSVKGTVPIDWDLAQSYENIVSSVPYAEEASDYDTAVDITDAAFNYLTYNDDYSIDSMDDVLEARQGVCYHYSRIAYVLLNYTGIPTRLVSGMFDNDQISGWHSWCESDIDGTWYIVDATNNLIAPVSDCTAYTEMCHTDEN